jgi:hypothetical protein
VRQEVQQQMKASGVMHVIGKSCGISLERMDKAISIRIGEWSPAFTLLPGSYRREDMAELELSISLSKVDRHVRFSIRMFCCYVIVCQNAFISEAAI